jgi:cytochrome c556
VNKRHQIILCSAVALSIFASGFLVAQAFAATPDIVVAIKSRKGNYKEIGGAFKTINDEIKTGAPNIDTIQPLSKDILKRAALQMNFFPAGSGPESGEKTRAKAEIWSDRDTFTQLHKDFIDAAQQLDAAITAGDIASLGAKQKAVGGTCKSCHDRFREPE